jgi:ABC-2 type transport system permease protein
MTTQLAAAAGTRERPERTGTVFDIGYRNYTGEREGVKRSRLAVYKDGIRIALGFGRGGRAKILPWFFIGVLAFIGLIMAIVAGAASRLGGPDAVSQLPSHGDYYGIAAIIIFIFAAIVAPELLCRDRREGTINLYLVRPLTGGDYIAARWAAFLTVVIAAAWLPQIILFLGLSMGDPDPIGYLRQHWLDIPRFLAAGIVMAAYATTIAMLVAAFTLRRAYASVFLVGLFVITTPFTIGMASEIGGTAGEWISMFNLADIPLYVVDLIFGKPSMLTKDSPAVHLPAATLILWYVAWTLIPGAILWWRYRRLSP